MLSNIHGSGMSCLENKRLFLSGFVLFLITLFFYLFSDVCFPFVAGFVLAYLFVSTVNFSSKYVNRTFVCFSLSVFLVSIFVAAGIVIIPKLKVYILYLAENLPNYCSNFLNTMNQISDQKEILPYKAEIDSLRAELEKYFSQKVYIVTSILSSLVSRKNTIAEFFSFLIIMPISFFYCSRDWNKLSTKIYNFIPLRWHSIANETFFIIRDSFFKFFRAQFYVAIALSAYYSIFLSFLNINNAIFFGILSGLFSFIPFIGALLSCLLVVFLSVTSLTFVKLCLIVLFYLIGQFVEGYILSPKFVGKGTGLHPLWILFSFFAGFKLFGVIGVLISIPITAIFRGLINFFVSKFKASQIYKQ